MADTNEKHIDGCMCDDCKLAGLDASADSTMVTCATCERLGCDADSTGVCPITGEETDDGYNTVAPGDFLL